MTQVLLVEDDDAVALIVEAVLAGSGRAVRRVSGAGAAREAAREAAPAVLVADLNLPDGEDGVTLARALRTEWPDLPVVLISGAFEGGEGTSGTATAEVPGGVCLAKPFRRAALLAAIDAAERWRG
ncbi:response regulator [Acidomonas methanolica]|uniref:Two component transcriptional regulator n=1 Tax=Acidomonas methanolica NBRC 104435 TaxID=1231351 RepID=A0A023D703_ACIMT|nr:response regulator [Acidomonas methanolica]MBU2655299.1 response regulator [Acidomonas methanolica]TCS23792.1 response regulator receiver domain-containing protein [Acidomonas methanolica]GAJ29864.1 two component transcriptional regulator [Acidomonas methanolica NBRC 104435]GBQ53320.1 CheY-like response regulator [Acidomonas methanolica]GEL00213.1 hypothetical protein AME01nite_27110 [Acidomonas methanolica NBRC 104435]